MPDVVELKCVYAEDVGATPRPKSTHAAICAHMQSGKRACATGYTNVVSSRQKKEKDDESHARPGYT